MIYRVYVCVCVSVYNMVLRYYYAFPMSLFCFSSYTENKTFISLRMLERRASELAFASNEIMRCFG